MVRTGRDRNLISRRGCIGVWFIGLGPKIKGWWWWWSVVCMRGALPLTFEPNLIAILRFGFCAAVAVISACTRSITGYVLNVITVRTKHTIEF